MPNAYRATKANRVRLARRVMSRTATADANWVVRLIRRRFASAEQRTAKRARNRAGAIPARIAKTAIIPTTAHVFRANKSLATIAKNARRTSVRHVTTDMNPIRTRANANPKLVRRDMRRTSGPAQTAGKKSIHRITRELPFVNSVSTAMRVKHALAETAKSLTATAVVHALPAKSMTETAVVKYPAHIRRNRLAQAVFPAAPAVPKTATVAITVRLAHPAIR